jgi:hypothetical protein
MLTIDSTPEKQAKVQVERHARQSKRVRWRHVLVAMKPNDQNRTNEEVNNKRGKRAQVERDCLPEKGDKQIQMTLVNPKRNNR